MIPVCLSQNLKADDTLSIAKAFIQKGKYKKAEKILSAYEQNHPNDLNGIWLYGQTAYWNEHLRTFRKVYDNAITRFPSNYYLKLDYAIKLAESGDIKKAAPLLTEYVKYDKNSSDLKLLVAKLAYWNSNYESALKQLQDEQLIKQKPKETETLRAEVRNAQSIWIKAGFDYLTDDQPLQQMIPSVEAGKSFNKFLSPFIAFQVPVFTTVDGTLNGIKAEIGNKFNFSNIGLKAAVNTGFIQLPNKEKLIFGGIELVKTTFNFLQLTAIASRQPYLSTISSVINYAVVPYHYELNMAWINQHSWNGKIISSYDQFTEDKNYVYNVGAWILSPPVKWTKLYLRMGYAFGYASSKDNKYTSKESLAKIITGYSSGKSIEGNYQPYFTPLNQHTHSVLLNIAFKPNKMTEAGLNTSIAFAGKLDNPYLFLDKTNSNELFINKGYSTINFYPKKADLFILCKFTKKASFKVNYTFFKNNFYTSHMIGASVILNFWNE